MKLSQQRLQDKAFFE